MPPEAISPNIEETEKITAGVDRYITFVGYPRSGHSLVGSLMDAHPSIVIAHELDALRMVEEGATKLQVWHAILDNSNEFTETGRKWQEYTYDVPGQWNGRCENLKVIGDKKGGRTTIRFGEHPHLIETLKKTMEVPCYFVHVVRNPFDNITTMSLRGGTPLAQSIQDYFWRCDAIIRIKPLIDEKNWIDVRHEDVVSDPKKEVARLCEFAGQIPTQEYLDACASIVFPSPKKTRQGGDWTPALIELVETKMKNYYQLEGYSFTS